MAEVETRLQAERQADICQVFANSTRILILWALANGEKSVGEIAAAVDASLQSTSQHLRIMRQMKILTSRREGTTVFYRIAGNGAEGSARAGCRLLLEKAPTRID